MNQDLLFGGFALAYGLFTLVARFAMPGSTMFRKLEPMRQRFGARAGTALHWAAYTLMPLGLGAMMLTRALAPGMAAQ
jgi:hypothetical protein